MGKIDQSSGAGFWENRVDLRKMPKGFRIGGILLLVFSMPVLALLTLHGTGVFGARIPGVYVIAIGLTFGVLGILFLAALIIVSLAASRREGESLGTVEPEREAALPEKAESMKRRLVVGAALILCFVTGAALVAGLNERRDDLDEAMMYDSRQEALSACQEETAGRSLSASEEQSRILGSFAEDWNVYYVLTEPRPYDGDESAVFYVARVQREGDRYGYFKVTADVCLALRGTEPPEGGSGYDYAEFNNVAGHRIGVGAIREEGLVPYVDGQPLPIGAGGAFATITDGSPIYITMVRP